MTKASADLDRDAVVAKVLGTSSEKDTADAVPREIIDRRRRSAAVARMRDMVAEGGIDFSVLEAE
ncbi:type II toxin-antitoxin system VapB family antitoxin [Nonomuraea sp. NPDC000554]|uniref:type II toxin-antitoxin system VapB family antitoxin n=1 Tax=Nonomuraea sp. NPDC000554 TaxID=3154259 RepID=UPI00331FFC81